MLKYNDMRVIDYIRHTAAVCKFMSRNGIDPRDIENVGLYMDWVRMREEGHKYQFIMYYLTTQYGKSESNVQRIVKRMEREVKI